MTNKELAQAAWAEFAQTTVGWDKVKSYPPDKLAATHWGKGKSLLDQIADPVISTPTLTKLSRKPPGYNGGDPRDPTNFPGFVVVDVNGPGIYPTTPDDTKDYFFRVNVDQLAPASGSRAGVYLRGGRHRVVIAPKVHLKSQSTIGDSSDPSAFILDDGNPLGTTHIEGFDLISANGITIRTKQIVQLQYGRIEARAFQQNQSSCHPDVIQVWDRGPSAGIYCDYVTGLTERTGWSVLMAPNPVRWENNHIQLIFDPNHAGPGAYYGDEKKTIWVGNDCWFKGGDGNNLDDSLAGWGADNVAYRITRASDGAIYINPESPNPPVGGNSPFGNQQGDKIDYPVIPQLSAMSWKFGVPANGDFVPAASVGIGYIPKGYM